VRQNDGFVFVSNFVALLAREHVDFALVQTQLADVRSQVEYVAALHGGLEHHRSHEVVGFSSAHDLRAALHAVQRISARDVDHHLVLVF